MVAAISVKRRLLPLRDFRQLAGVKAARAAELVGVHVNTLYNWETGKSEPSASEDRELREFYRAAKAAKQ